MQTFITDMPSKSGCNNLRIYDNCVYKHFSSNKRYRCLGNYAVLLYYKNDHLLCNAQNKIDQSMLCIEFHDGYVHHIESHKISLDDTIINLY